MAKTIHRDKYKIVNQPTDIDDAHWNNIFKRDRENIEKNRYKRGDGHNRKRK